MSRSTHEEGEIWYISHPGNNNNNYPNASEQFESSVCIENCIVYLDSLLHGYNGVESTAKIRRKTKQALANSKEKENEYFAGIRRDSVMEMGGKICGTDYWN